MSKTESENQGPKKMIESQKKAILYRLDLAKQELQKIVYILNETLPDGMEKIYEAVDHACDVLMLTEYTINNYKSKTDALSEMDQASDDLEKLYEEQVEKDKRARKFVREE